MSCSAITSTNDIYVDEMMEDCLTDWINQTETEMEGKAAANHAHSGYAETNHTHDGYAATDHVHTGYANAEHTHTGFAAENHSHSEYATSSHTHSQYANASHSHTEYANAEHTHSDYASSNHSHTAADVGKPSGVYSGNGGSQIINTGGTGDVILVQLTGSGGGMALVSKSGAICKLNSNNTVSGLGSDEAKFVGGVLTLNSSNYCVNRSGYGYNWQVL